MDFKLFLRESEESYHMAHRPAGKDDGSPYHNVCLNTYPDDFYTLPLTTAARYYGSHHPDDVYTIHMIRQAHDKPETKVKIYRAIPKILNSQARMEEYKRQKSQILRTGRMPTKPDEELLSRAKRKGFAKLSSAYYEELSDAVERLEKLPPEPEPKISINRGDWVTTSRAYATGHGAGPLRGNYRILTKTVKAKDLYTDGNSIMEFGYDPQN